MSKNRIPPLSVASFLLLILLAVPEYAEPTASIVRSALQDRQPQVVTYQAEDGIKIWADIYLGPSGKRGPLVMLFHQGDGNGRGEYGPIIPRLLQEGWSVIAVDQRTGGNLFGSVNRTVENLKEQEFSYCDAYKDLAATLRYVKQEGFTGKRLAWGSSYSATLTIRLGTDFSGDIAGILAFSPAGGPQLEPCKVELYLPRLKQPLLVMRPASELVRESVKEQFSLFQKHGRQTYVAENGVHGSSMLVQSRVKGDVEAHWKTVTRFINQSLDSQAQKRATVSERSGKRVVLIALRGASDGRVDDYLTRGLLPPDGGLAHLAKFGARAEYMLGVDGTFTSTATVSLLTGAYPEKHGFVGNIFHTRGDPISRPTSGFEGYFDAETLAEAATRQGKRVINLAPIHPNGSKKDAAAVSTLLPGEEVAQARVLSLEPARDGQHDAAPAAFEEVKLLQLAPSHSPEIDVPSEGLKLYAFAIDSVRDGTRHFDSLLLDNDRNLENGYMTVLRHKDWQPVKFTSASRAAGAWVKLLTLTPDLQQAQIYFGAIYTNKGWPSDFIESIGREVGLWPGYPDSAALTGNLIDEQTFMEQAERLANYKRDVARFCLRRLNFDLLLLDENIVDNVSHQFFLLEPRQTGYAEEGGFKRQRYTRYIERSYEVADLNLGQLMGAAPRGTNFVVASPYGMAPTHTAIPINDLLVKAGIRVAPDDTAEARAYAYGPLAHIYVNIAGQTPRGIVPPRHFKHYVDRIVRALRKARDPVTGEAIFERILTRSELPRLRMDHSLTAGDVVVFARRGYVISGEVGTRQAQPRFLGDHGYLSNMPEMRGIFMAVGTGVPKASLGVVRTVDVAPAVSALLGISAPSQSQGKNILGPQP